MVSFKDTKRDLESKGCAECPLSKDREKESKHLQSFLEECGFRYVYLCTYANKG